MGRLRRVRDGGESDGPAVHHLESAFKMVRWATRIHIMMVDVKEAIKAGASVVMRTLSKQVEVNRFTSVSGVTFN